MAPHKPSLSLLGLEFRSRNLLTCVHLKVRGFPLLIELFLLGPRPLPHSPVFPLRCPFLSFNSPPPICSFVYSYGLMTFQKMLLLAVFTLYLAYPWARLTFWGCSSGHEIGQGVMWNYCEFWKCHTRVDLKSQFSLAGSRLQVLKHLSTKPGKTNPSQGREHHMWKQKEDTALPASLSERLQNPIKEEKLSWSLLRNLQKAPRAKAQTLLL